MLPGALHRSCRRPANRAAPLTREGTAALVTLRIVQKRSGREDRRFTFSGTAPSNLQVGYNVTLNIPLRDGFGRPETQIGVVPVKRRRSGDALSGGLPLSEIDALAGEYVTQVPPSVYWEDASFGFRYDSLCDAVEALRDPILQGFLFRDPIYDVTLEEIHEYPPYSSELASAFLLVEKLSHLAFRLNHAGEMWTAGFGTHPDCAAGSAPLAITLAALRVKRVEVSPQIGPAGQTT